MTAENSAPGDNDTSTAKTTLGGGCFWCLEAIFEELVGVSRVESGYAGGDEVDPTYKAVCSGETGHAEVVQVTFDPALIPYETLLSVFFTVHDPTTLNRQGADVGTQYRSVVFYHDLEQQQIAERMIAEVESEKVWPDPVVTQVVPLQTFYPAEDYHQEYYANNQRQPYCQFVISPKVSKFREKYEALLKQP